MRYFTKGFTFVLIHFFSHSLVNAQTAKYFIAFTDKLNSPYSLSLPQEFLSQRAIDRRNRQNISLSVRDLPVNPDYIAQIKKAGATVFYSSRWMNSVLIETDESTLTSIKNLPFVKKSDIKSFDKINFRQAGNNSPVPSKNTQKTLEEKQTITPKDYGNSLNQLQMIGADAMHKQGFTGKGMRIAIFDSGFRRANQNPCFQHLFAANKILDTHDFVSQETDVYDDDSHGLSVFSVMAAYQPGSLIGSAFEADYILLRTEDTGSEYRIEEVNWLLAAEFADSAGVDVINSSLGYNYFSNSKMNYKNSDMDGNTALSTQAADLAASAGILVVCSAGNEGNDSWGTITAPADADSVLSVGAVDERGNYAGFSSRGLTADGRTKPNVSGQGSGTVVSLSSGSISTSSGTSFSSPLMAGMAAGFWQAHPELSNMQVIDYLQRSANQADKPDIYLGYGIPNFVKADRLVQIDKIIPEKKYILAENPFSANKITVFLDKILTEATAQIQITDSQGKIVFKKENFKLMQETVIYLPNRLSTGVYLLNFISPDLKFTERVVKQ
ncbi:MAG: S8 family peptidase [Verrucomicrobia bacterium]|nr:S8 family peptidase [Cytophagales bacterium]